MLSVRGAIKSFGGNTVVDNVDFDVEAGEVHALLGANGAGKSTLINILGGRFRDAGGTVSLDGCDLRLDSPMAALRSGIGIVHQEFDLVPEMDAAENIFLGRETNAGMGKLFQPIKRGQLRAAARQLLDRYDLRVDLDTSVKDLPVAARQLTQIARALALESNVVIFDEPTARLGPSDRALLFTIFNSLKAAGKKLIFVTHYLDEVLQVADRATVMRDGKVVATLPIAQASVAGLSRLMVGEDVARPARARSIPRGPSVLVLENHQGAGFAPANLTLNAGEIVGLVGHPGSGRHELTRSIVSKLRKARGPHVPTVGLLPEDRRAEGMFPQMSVGDNISLGVLARAAPFSLRPKADERQVADQVIAELGVRARNRDQRISELSGGNQQKAVFGRAMVQAPKLYVIESPTVGVDVRAAAELHSHILRLAENGASIVLATDDIDEALLLADRTMVMFRGKIVAEYSHDTASRQALVSAMGAA